MLAGDRRRVAVLFIKEAAPIKKMATNKNKCLTYYVQNDNIPEYERRRQQVPDGIK